MMRIVRSHSWPTNSSSTWTTTTPYQHHSQSHLSHTSPILLSHYSHINQTYHQRQLQRLQKLHVYFNTNSTTIIYPTSATIGLHQELRQFLCSEECHLLKPYFHSFTWKSDIGLSIHFYTIFQHPIPDIYLQSMLQICCILTNKSDAPEPHRLLQSLLNYLNSLQIRLLRPIDLLHRLHELSACIPSVIEEICLLLHRFSFERQSSANEVANHAWTLFMESGASIQTPYFLRLLLLQQGGPSCSSGSTLPQRPGLSVGMIVSLLQSFVRHFTTELLEPLVHTISATRMLILEADHSSTVCLSEIQRCASTSTSCGPYFNRASILLPQLPAQTQRVNKFIPSHVLYSLVYDLFMHLGPESIERVGPACRQVLTSFKLSNNTASILALPSSTEEQGKPRGFSSHDHHLTGTATTPTFATWSQFEYEVMKLNQAEFQCATASKFI